MTEAKEIEQTFTYRVVRGCIQIPGNKTASVNRAGFLQQGQLIPDGMFPESDLQSWLADGRIAPSELTEQGQAAAREHQKHRSKWAVDPATLVGKSMEDLLLMVIDIDPEFDTDQLTSEVDAIRLLTTDWNPAYADSVARSKDRSKPVSFMIEHRSYDSGPKVVMTEKAMSAEAEAALARARARAGSKNAESK